VPRRAGSRACLLWVALLRSEPVNGLEVSDVGAERAESCGCSASARRVCESCEEQGHSFLACSLACLDRHRAAAHGEPAEPNSVTRARRAARELNARFSHSWESYAGHRQCVAELVARLPQGAELCVFGAGNGNDLDLERFSGAFSAIYLVDLDGEALERARDRQGAQAKAKIVLRPDVDCSGMLEHLDAWGERFPTRLELGQSAVLAAQAIVRGLGRSFPAVVSTCVLSQLALPFQRAWVTSRSNWADLLSTISAVHLATLTGSTAPGGQGLLVFDTSSSRDTPALSEQRGRSGDELEEFVAQARAAGGLSLRPEPAQLMQQLSAPGLKSLVAAPTLSAPWLWHLGADTQLVYGLSFTHPQP